METKDRMLSTEELAEFLNVKPWTVKYKLVKNGMPHYRIGRNGQGHFRFLLDEVLPWLKEGSLTGTEWESKEVWVKPHKRNITMVSSSPRKAREVPQG